MDSDIAKKRFDEFLRERFTPELRQLGFEGDRRYFYRKVGHVIHCLNVQLHERGGRTGLNMGVHLDFLPNISGQIVSPESIREDDCDFRNHLHPDMTGDYWWEHQGKLRSPEAKAKSLINTYKRSGEPFLQHFSTLEAILEDVTYRRLKSLSTERCRLGLSAYTNQSRACLTIAKIREHLGQDDEAQRFAELGLTLLGHGDSQLGAELRKIAGGASIA